MSSKLKTVSDFLSCYVEDIEFKDVSKGALVKVKQHVLDTLGCILYGFSSPSASIIRRLSLGSSKQESTIIGVSKKSSCLDATLANGVALRQSEYMDYLAIPISESVSLAHPSEVIPGALAMSEMEGSSGRDFLLSVFIGYELCGRFCALPHLSSLAEKGWHLSTVGYLVVPFVIGKLLRMNSEQLSNAMGISGCQATLGIIDAEGEEYAMVKNLAFPLSAQTGIISAMLAKDGFTGTRRVIEGEKGFIKSILKEEVNLDTLLKAADRPWIFETRLKPYPVCGASQCLTDAAVNIARKHQVKPSEVESILVKTNRRSVRHVGDPVKTRPSNKETADHSAPFHIALAILEGDVRPEHFKEDMYRSPTVLELIDKVKLEVSQEFMDPKIYPAAEVKVKTKDAAVYSHKTLYHRGHPKNPMSEKETEDKFLRASSGRLGEDKAREVIKAIRRLDKMSNIVELSEILKT